MDVDTVLKQHQRVALAREHVLLGKRRNPRDNKSGRKNAIYGSNFGVPFFVTGIKPHGRLDSVVLHCLVQNT